MIQTHFIDRLNVTFATDQLPNTERISEWTQNHLLEALDTVLCEIIPTDKVIMCDTLELSLNLSSAAYLDGSQEELLRQLKREVKAMLNLDSTELLQSEVFQYETDILLDYFKHGVITRHIAREQMEVKIGRFVEQLFLDEKIRQKAIVVFKDFNAFHRFVKAATFSQVSLFLETITSIAGLARNLAYFFFYAERSALFIDAQTLLRTIHQVFYDYLSSGASTPGTMVGRIIKRSLVPGIDLKGLERVREELPAVFDPDFSEFVNFDEAQVDDVDTRAVGEVVEEHDVIETRRSQGKAGIASYASGIVLLAPFLGRWFEKLELTDDRGMLTDPARATLLLHYLVTKQTSANEWELALLKILTGISPAQDAPASLKYRIMKSRNPNSCFNQLLNTGVALESRRLTACGILFCKERVSSLTKARIGDWQ